MRILEAARTLLLLLAGFALGAQLGAGPVEEKVKCEEDQ